MRMRLVTISLSSVLYYTMKRNTNILLRSPGMILFRQEALKRYKKHKHAKTLLFEYSERGLNTPLTYMGTLLESMTGFELPILTPVAEIIACIRFLETRNRGSMPFPLQDLCLI